MQTDFYGKLPSLKFVVKNVSPQRKSITIFNLSIPFGRSVDLLELPDVSEGDIRSSLAKGELANKIRVGDIQIVSSTIDLVQFDPNQEAFINSASADPGVPVEGTELPVGPQGAQGFQGDAGSAGPQGTAGVQGDTGAQGPQGDVGAQGDAGSAGPQGTAGAQGDAGSAGPQGTAGVQGDAGAQGPQGDVGAQGTAGAQGNQGTQGNQGSQGATGPAPAGTGLVYVTGGTPSAIANGSTGQVLTVSGGAPVWGGGTYPDYDLNTIHAWRCDRVVGGTTVPADVGSVNLVGSDIQTATGYCYKHSKSIINTLSSGHSAFSTNSLPSYSTTQTLTIECIFMVRNFVNIPSYVEAIQIGIYPQDFTGLRYRKTGDGASGFPLWINGGSVSDYDFTWSPGYNQITPNEPHHFMISWLISGSPASSTVISYCDGRIINSGSGFPVRGYPLTIFTAGVPSLGGSIADIRISNVARSQSYAIAATNAMRAM